MAHGNFSFENISDVTFLGLKYSKFKVKIYSYLIISSDIQRTLWPSG